GLLLGLGLLSADAQCRTNYRTVSPSYSYSYYPSNVYRPSTTYVAPRTYRTYRPIPRRSSIPGFMFARRGS
ncbi:MAG: hypothetical protein AAF492_29485, partial [Verrucomicrobiota bacterium]